MSIALHIGDCRAVLATLPAASVHCVVTSPPYWGLRDYGCDGQLGLEPDFNAYVANMVGVFREVRRVLRDDGTLWLNLGDSYASGGRGNGANGSKQQTNIGSLLGSKTAPDGLKPKDLCGIPWKVAQALQAPYYTGRIKTERDRVWLAATLEAEGTICGFTHQRKDNGDIRRGVHIAITNSNTRMLDECYRIWTTSRHDHNPHGNGHLGKLDIFRWIAHGVEEKAQLLAELYPYMICKKSQALLAWNFFQISAQARGRNKGEDGDRNRERCAWIVHTLSRLNRLEHVDLPAWLQEPPSMYEPGWYLRQDIVWSKPNPMPESVTDRCTKSHEYIFLLSKRERYYYDAEAIAEPSTGQNGAAAEFFRQTGNRQGRIVGDSKPSGNEAAYTGREDNGTRNKRSVWEVTTQPFSDWGETVRRVRVAWDEPCDGKKRITSRDCPLHGDQSDLAPMVVGDGHEADRNGRIGHIETRRVQEPLSGSALSGTHHRLTTSQYNADLPNLSCSVSAIDHNNQSHRTGLVPASDPACSVSAQIPFRTLDTSKERESFDSGEHIPASNNALGEIDCNSKFQTTDRNDHKSIEQEQFEASHGSVCTCEWYVEKTEKTSHFATFPPALIEPCIKAGTSEKGCCGKCGKPWVRETKSLIEHSQAIHNGTKYGGIGQFQNQAANRHRDGHIPGHKVTTTLGWSPSCACTADPVPCTVLDPFAGAGTTGLVADRLQRNAILIELNPAYAAMSQNRIKDDAPLFVEMAP